MLYHNLQAVVQVNGRRSRTFAIKRSVRQGCPLSLLLCLRFGALFRTLRDERARLALCGISLTGSVRAKISALAVDITVFVSRRLDIVAVKMAVERYEKMAGAKVNFDKSEGLRLGAWRGGVPLPRPFRWSEGSGLGPASSWSEIGWKYRLR